MREKELPFTAAALSPQQRTALGYKQAITGSGTISQILDGSTGCASSGTCVSELLAADAGVSTGTLGDFTLRQSMDELQDYLVRPAHLHR